MAEDKLLKIQNDSIQRVVDTIKTKAGLSSETKLLFPNEFISTLENLKTYDNATDKIAPETIRLTPSQTTWTVQSGTHNGEDNVSVSIHSDTIEITPSINGSIIEATDDEFLGNILIKAIESSQGKKIKVGTKTYNSSTDTFEINNLNFKPEGAVIMLQSYGSNSNVNKVVCVTTYEYGDSNRIGYFGSKNDNNLFASDDIKIELNNNSITYTPKNDTTHSSSATFYGTYYYIIWGV